MCFPTSAAGLRRPDDGQSSQGLGQTLLPGCSLTSDKPSRKTVFAARHTATGSLAKTVGLPHKPVMYQVGVHCASLCIEVPSTVFMRACLAAAGPAFLLRLQIIRRSVGEGKRGEIRVQ